VKTGLCEKKMTIVPCIACVSFRDFITHDRIKVEAKYFGSSCRTMRCTVPDKMTIDQGTAVLFSSFKNKTKVTFQSFVIVSLPIYIYLFRKEFGHLIYSR
jgi:hypothetical protein